MKVFSKVVIDMATGKVVEQVIDDPCYTGPIAKCDWGGYGGGGYGGGYSGGDYGGSYSYSGGGGGSYSDAGDYGGYSPGSGYDSYGGVGYTGGGGAGGDFASQAGAGFAAAGGGYGEGAAIGAGYAAGGMAGAEGAMGGFDGGGAGDQGGPGIATVGNNRSFMTNFEIATSMAAPLVGPVAPVLGALAAVGMTFGEFGHAVDTSYVGGDYGTAYTGGRLGTSPNAMRSGLETGAASTVKAKTPTVTEEEGKARKRRGLKSQLATGPLGVPKSPADVRRKTLLGGI